MVKPRLNESMPCLPTWHCDLCNKNFQTKALVKMHIRRFHK